MTESYAIAIHVADLVPDAGLIARLGDAARGPHLAWLLWAVTELEPVLARRLYGVATDDATFAAAVRGIDAALAAGPYLTGDRFTAIDVMVGGTLAWARTAMPDSATLDTYLDRIAERRAYVRACNRDAPVSATA